MLNRFYVALLLIVVSAARAGAQEKGQFGITLGYPASAGVVWHASDSVGLRTALSFSRASSEVDIELPALPSFPGLPELPGVFPTESQSSSWALTLTLNGLFYLSKADQISTYVSPQYSYSRFSSSNDFGFIDVDGLAQGTHGIGGLFGVQYAANRRFSLFGEAGLEYRRSHGDDELESLTATTFGSRAGIGVVVYLGH